MEFVPPA